MASLPLTIKYHIKDSYHLRPLPRKSFWGYTVFTEYENKTYMGEGATLAIAIQSLINNMQNRNINVKYMSSRTQYNCRPGYEFETTLDNVLNIEA